jgi:hypothetical protein
MGHFSNIRLEIELHGAFTRADADEVLATINRLNTSGIRIEEFVVNIDSSTPELSQKESAEFGHILGEKLHENGVYAAIIYPHGTLNGPPEYLIIDSYISSKHRYIAQFDNRADAENWLSIKRK